MRSMSGALIRFAQRITEHVDLAELRTRGFVHFEPLKGVDRASIGSLMKEAIQLQRIGFAAHNVSPRKDEDGVDLISNVLPFSRLCYRGANAGSKAVGYAQHYNH